MSDGPPIGVKDFARLRVLAAIQPLIGAKSVAVATAAITVFAMDSPYTDDWSAPQWLAGIGKGTIPGLAPRRAPVSPLNDGAAKELRRIATSGASPELRALAIRALARSHAIPPVTIAAWFREPSTAVRRAAVLASAAMPDHATIKAASTDSSSEVRQAAALAVGFTQDPRLVPLLSKMLRDPAANVRAAAANPQPYLPMLAKVIEQRSQPADWWGGYTPAVDSWDILFDYIKARPAADLASGKLDRCLDALEQSPPQPPELYALYLNRGLMSRAKQYRDAIRKSPAYIDSVFDTIERNPAAYAP